MVVSVSLVLHFNLVDVLTHSGGWPLSVGGFGWLCGISFAGDDTACSTCPFHGGAVLLGLNYQVRCSSLIKLRPSLVMIQLVGR